MLQSGQPGRRGLYKGSKTDVVQSGLASYLPAKKDARAHGAQATTGRETRIKNRLLLSGLADRASASSVVTWVGGRLAPSHGGTCQTPLQPPAVPRRGAAGVCCVAAHASGAQGAKSIKATQRPPGAKWNWASSEQGSKHGERFGVAQRRCVRVGEERI